MAKPKPPLPRPLLLLPLPLLPRPLLPLLKLRSPPTPLLLLKLRSPPKPLLLLLPLRLPQPLLLRLLPPPLLRLPLLPLLRPLQPLLLRLPLLPPRRSNSSRAVGQEKASLRAGFFVMSPTFMSGTVSRRYVTARQECRKRYSRVIPIRVVWVSQITPGKPVLLGCNANPVLLATQRRGQCSPSKLRTVVLFRDMRCDNMTQA